jgi:hypothetical protein
VYLFASSLAAALFGEMRVLARWGGRVRTVAFLSILKSFWRQHRRETSGRILALTKSFCSLRAEVLAGWQ